MTPTGFEYMFDNIKALRWLDMEMNLEEIIGSLRTVGARIGATMVSLF
jgi:hypothetical protein